MDVTAADRDEWLLVVDLDVTVDGSTQVDRRAVLRVKRSGAAWEARDAHGEWSHVTGGGDNPIRAAMEWLAGSMGLPHG